MPRKMGEITGRALTQGWDLQRDEEWKGMTDRMPGPESNEVRDHGVWGVWGRR